MSDLTFKPAVELAELIRDRQIGCLELLDHYLERVSRYNPQLNAIIVQDADRARQADAALARGEVWGPLHGVPQPYFQQTFWAGLANCACLPSTVVPAGLGADDLPIGVQIIGPEYGDLKTIGLAKLLEGAGFAFTPPPCYC